MKHTVFMYKVGHAFKWKPSPGIEKLMRIPIKLRACTKKKTKFSNNPRYRKPGLLGTGGVTWDNL